MIDHSDRVAFETVYSLYASYKESKDPHIYYTNDSSVAPSLRWSCYFIEIDEDNVDHQFEYIAYHKSILFDNVPVPEYVTIKEARKVRAGEMELIVIEETGVHGVELFDAESCLLSRRHLIEGEDLFDSTVFTWGSSGHCYIKVTARLIDWARTIFQRMQTLVRPEWISRFKDISMSTEQRNGIVFKRRKIYEMMDNLTTKLKSLEEANEENERRNVQTMIEEMSATVCA